MPALVRRLFRRLALVAVLGALIGAAPASEPSGAAIDSAVLANFPKNPHTSMSVSIVHDGRVVYAKGFGYRDDGTPDRFIAKDQNYYGLPFARARSGRMKADARTIYAIGSVSRQFTAAAILLLNERGRLRLDDAVAEYVPDVKTPNLTLRMLLNQRSGLPDMNTLAFMQRVRPLARRSDGTFDMQRVAKEIAALPRDFAPDANFEYSTSNYFVLGAIVERVAHEPLAAFFEENILRPLGMTRTAYGKPAAVDDVAIGYRLEEGGAIRRAYPWDLAWLGGAGALTSTVEDLARWNTALLSHRILTPASLAQMWRGADAGRGQGSYAMGWIEDALGSHRYLWHNGEVGGFHALNVIFPGDDLAFTLLANNQDERPEFLLPGIAALFFPVSGLDRILPRSGKVLVEASAAVGLGALAIAVVAIATLRRFIVGGIISALLALVLGFFLPTIAGFVWAGILALLPIAAYLAAVRFIPKVIAPPPKKARSR